MTSNDTRQLPRWAVLPFSMGLGAVAAAILLDRDRTWMAVVAFVLVTGYGAVVAFWRSDWAVAQTDHADERQAGMHADSIRFAYFAVIAVAVVGLFGELADGEPGPYTIICAVGGFTNIVSLAVLQRVR